MKSRWVFFAALATLSFADKAAADPTVVALTSDDEAAYRAAFNAIEAHNWNGVRHALSRAQDDVLEGVVRGRMLLDPAYKPSRSEMTAWLQRYGDLAIADDVYDRARNLGRQVRGRRRHRHVVYTFTPPSPQYVAPRAAPGAPPLVPDDTAQARVQIVHLGELVGGGDLDAAQREATKALDGPRSGQAHWWLGIIAFKQQDYGTAVREFEAAAQWPYHNAWNLAAAHYWAARARLAAGETNGVVLHFEAAALSPWTFYGQLAEDQLGRDSALDFSAPELKAEDAEKLMRHPAARRAAALAQLGRLSEVEDEMRTLHRQITPDEDRIYLALAIALAAPSAQLRAAEYSTPPLAAGYCPAHNFEPQGGFTLDRALIYAVVRQESYFNPRAKSATNARGLMQLLPSTANDLDRSYRFRHNPGPLFDPSLNMRLGQDYLHWLMDEFHNDGDLGRVFAAYNGGPGWLGRWLNTQSDASDPLLLLETLPRADSRDYAERVLSHMTLCRKSFAQPTPELDHLAAGQPALYQPLDSRTVAAER
jgi:peptidoglycan lytic transglycosylase